VESIAVIGESICHAFHCRYW